MPVRFILLVLCVFVGPADARNGIAGRQKAEVSIENPFSFSYNFLNLMKIGLTVFYGDASDNGVQPDELGTNGYPLYGHTAPGATGTVGFTSHDGYQWKTQSPPQIERPGNYVLTWVGASDVNVVEYGVGDLSAGDGTAVFVSCTGTHSAFASSGQQCNNTACTTFDGYTVGTILTVTATGGAHCPLVVGQPFSGQSVTTTVTDFGIPTIITGKSGSSNCPSCTGAGGTGTYLINFSQTVGSSGTPVTFRPGGRMEFSITGEVVYQPSFITWKVQLRASGSSLDNTNLVSSLGFYYSCTNTGACSGDNDEAVYWTGQLVGTKFKSIWQDLGMSTFRDLGFVLRNNRTNITTWASRKPSAYIVWVGDDLRASIYAGTATDEGTSTPVTFTGEIQNSSICANGGACLLSVTGISGTLALGMYLDGNPGISGNIYIDSMFGPLCPVCTGTGGNGTYKMSANLAVAAPASMGVTIQKYKLSSGLVSSPPADKETIIIKWPTDAPNKTSIYFSADNGVTYRPIFNEAGVPNIYDSSHPAAPTPVNANWVNAMVYDAAFGAWLSTYDVGNTASGIINQVPPEVTAKIASELGADVYYVAPYMSVDPITDYAIQQAKHIQSNYPTMRPQFEAPNELWNGATNPGIYAKVKTYAWSALDTQLLQTSAIAPASQNDITFSSVPSYVAIGSAAGANVSGLGASSAVTGKSATTVTVDRTITTQLAAGTWVGFAWSGAGLSDQYAQNWGGKVASNLCQAVFAVYQDRNKYYCTVGMQNNAVFEQGMDITNAVLLSSAYVGQNPANIPTQSGCAGPVAGPLTAIQTSCPAPFLVSPAYNWVTNTVVQTYWNMGEWCDTSNPGKCGTDTNNRAFWTSEVVRAFEYFNGSATTRRRIMDDYYATAVNSTRTLGSIGSNAIQWQEQSDWLRTCAGKSPCPLKHSLQLAYEGGFSNPNPVAANLAVRIRGATAANPCVLSTVVTTAAGIINSNGNNGNTTPGNVLSWTSGATPNFLLGSIITGTNVKGQPKIIGYNSRSDINTQGFIVDGPAQYAASGTVSGGPISASPGMSVSITSGSNLTSGSYDSGTGIATINLSIALNVLAGDTLRVQNVSYVPGDSVSPFFGSYFSGPQTAIAGSGGSVVKYQLATGLTLHMNNNNGDMTTSGGDWGRGNPYTVQSGVTPGGTPINLDCTGLDPTALTGADMTYENSTNYFNFFRAMSYADAYAAYWQQVNSDTFVNMGGRRSSQLNITGSVSPLGGWTILANDLYGKFSVTTFWQATISGTTMTVGAGYATGTCDPGMEVIGNGITPGTVVVSGRGAAQGDTVTVSPSQTVAGATFTGTNSGATGANRLIVSGVSGTIIARDSITGPGIPAQTYLSRFDTITGEWVLNNTVTGASGSMVSAPRVTCNITTKPGMYTGFKNFNAQFP